MSEQRFSLMPFPSARLLPHIEITGGIVRRLNTLSLRYTLLGPLGELTIPAQADRPGRKNGLWEETCFELFLGEKKSDHYLEFNLSPSGNWNVYRFTSYREGMIEEPAFASLPFHIEVRQDSLTLSLEFGLDRIVPVGKALEVAISAVVKTIAGGVSYWALVHPGPQPDFHRRDGFILEV